MVQSTQFGWIPCFILFHLISGSDLLGPYYKCMCPSQPSISATPASGLGNDCLNIIAQISEKARGNFSFFVSFLYRLYYGVLSQVDFYSTSCKQQRYSLLYSFAFPRIPVYFQFFSRNYDLHIISRPAQKENPAVPDFLTSQLLLITIRKKSSQTFSLHISAISSGKGFFHGTKNKNNISFRMLCQKRKMQM